MSSSILDVLQTYSYAEVMEGFDPKFKDLPDYILGITEEIWEDRGIATLNQYYAPDIVVRSPNGVVVGNQGVIAATMATLAEFPDRQLLGEDVIWSGDPASGFLSSHRIISTATHTGTGVYGSATGTKLRYRIIADCAAKENQIYDEWLIRDQGAIVRQLGLDPRFYAANQIADEGGPDAAQRPFSAQSDQPGPYKGTGNENEWGVRYSQLLNALMAGDMASISQNYDRSVGLELPGGITAIGRASADQFWMSLRSSFPNATFEIHHQIGNEGDTMAPRAAVRWSLSGKHEGFGSFGNPTGADVYVMGISHAEFGPRGIRREFVLFDETQIWKQILLHNGG